MIFKIFVECIIITPNLAESVGVAASMVGTYIPLDLLEKIIKSLSMILKLSFLI